MVDNKTFRKGLSRTRSLWIIMLLYGAFVLFSSYMLEFRKFQLFKKLVEYIYIPPIISDNLDVIGYYSDSKYGLWFLYLDKVALLFFSVVASRVIKPKEDNDSFYIGPEQESQTNQFSETFFLIKM
jgi:hypothetical protein